MNRSIVELNALYDKLPKKPDGSIKTKQKDGYGVRTGLTQQPLFRLLDVTKVYYFHLKLTLLISRFLADKKNHYKCFNFRKRLEHVPNQNCVHVYRSPFWQY